MDEARSRLPGLAQQLIDRVGAILQIRQQVRQRVGAAAGLAAPRSQTLTHLSALGQPAAPRSANPLATELTALAPARFLDRIPFERLPHLPRYLKALLIRAERAALNPLKDQERARQLAPYQDSLQRWETNAPRSAEARRQLEEFRWMIQEYKVSLFAQELGTAAPVSPKRLDQQLERIRQAG